MIQELKCASNYSQQISSNMESVINDTNSTIKQMLKEEKNNKNHLLDHLHDQEEDPYTLIK